MAKKTLSEQKDNDYTPTFEDRMTVACAKALGHSLKSIQVTLGITKKQLENLFPHELELGGEVLINRVAAKQVERALSDELSAAAVTAATFVLTHIGGLVKAENKTGEKDHPNLTFARNMPPVARQQAVANILKKGAMVDIGDEGNREAN